MSTWHIGPYVHVTDTNAPHYYIECLTSHRMMSASLAHKNSLHFWVLHPPASALYSTVQSLVSNSPNFMKLMVIMTMAQAPNSSTNSWPAFHRQISRICTIRFTLWHLLVLAMIWPSHRRLNKVCVMTETRLSQILSRESYLFNFLPLWRISLQLCNTRVCLYWPIQTNSLH